MQSVYCATFRSRSNIRSDAPIGRGATQFEWRATRPLYRTPGCRPPPGPAGTGRSRSAGRPGRRASAPCGRSGTGVRVRSSRPGRGSRRRGRAAGRTAPITNQIQKELPLPLADDAGGEAEEEGDDEVLHAPILAVRRAWVDTSRQANLPKGDREARPTNQEEPSRVHLAAWRFHRTLSERGEAEAARTAASASTSGRTSTTAGSPDGRRRLARPGLHLPPPPQAASATTSAGPGKKPPRRAAGAAPPRPSTRDPRPAGAYQGPFGRRAGDAAAEPGRLRAGAGPGRAAGLAGPGRRGPVADPAERRRRPSSARRRSTTTATRSPPPTPGATTTSGGSTAWSAPTSRWSSGWRWSSTTGSRPRTTGVSKQQQMIDQSNLFRAACFGSFLDLFKAVTVDPAMLQWLNGAENRKGAPNENYGARDDGAVQPRRRPRRLHRGRHPRTGAGADRLAQRLVERARAPTTSASTPNATTPNSKTVFGQTGNWGWEDACRLCVENPLHPSFFVDKLWSYFVPQPPSAATRERADRHLPRLRLADPPGARGDPDQPRLLRRPADGQAAGRPARRDAAGARPLHRHRRLDLALRTGRAGALLAAERLRLGRHPLARHLADAGALEHRRLRPRRASPSTPGTAPTARPRPPTKRWRGRSPPGARRRCAPSTGPSCSTSPGARRN